MQHMLSWWSGMVKPQKNVESSWINTYALFNSNTRLINIEFMNLCSLSYISVQKSFVCKVCEDMFYKIVSIFNI